MPSTSLTRDFAVPSARYAIPRYSICRLTMCGVMLCGACIGSPTLAYAQSGTQSGTQSGSRAHEVSSKLPVSQPTAAQPAYTPDPAYVAPAPPAPQSAEITYADSLLTVSANDSSINQILREISRQTGMKITGGVNDERVFGTYGPAAPAMVLTALLVGTGSNVLIVQSPDSLNRPAAAPVELVLTPRHGGPTPPNPSAMSFNDSATPPDSNPAGQVPPLRPYPGAAQRLDQGRSPNASTPPPGTPTSSDDTPAGPAPTQDQSPNGIKTPQQIYEQLLRLRQQSQQPPPP